jgi:hypothetical protein
MRHIYQRQFYVSITDTQAYYILTSKNHFLDSLDEVYQFIESFLRMKNLNVSARHLLASIVLKSLHKQKL